MNQDPSRKTESSRLLEEWRQRWEELRGRLAEMREENDLLRLALGKRPADENQEEILPAPDREEDPFRAILNAIPDLFFVTDEQGIYVDFHTPDPGLLIARPEDFLGKSIREIHSPDLAERMMATFNTVMATGEPQRIEYAIEIRGGERFFESRIIRMNPHRLLSIVRDVTGRKQAEQERNRISSQLSEAQKIAHIGSWEYSAADNHLAWSDETHRIFGTERGVFSETYEGFLAMVHPDERLMVEERYALSLKDPHFLYDIEHRIIRHDNGEIRHVHEKCSHQRDADGNVFRSIGIVHDVTEIRAVESDRQRLLTAVDQAAEIILLTDPEGTILYANATFEKITGYPVNEVLGKTPALLKSGHHDDSFYRTLWETVTSGSVWSGRFVNRKKDGSLYTEQATIAPVFGPDGAITHFVAAKQDITEQLATEEQLRQSQKLETVGRLAAGVAHDYNNILQIIIGQAEIGRDKTEAETPLRSCFDAISHAAWRSARITSQLLAFSGQRASQPISLDLNAQIDSMLKMIRHLLPKIIKLEWTPDPEVCSICADPSGIDQMVMNLCVNAGDAIEHAGSIRISTHRRVLDAPRPVASGDTLPPGDYVLLRVEDSGHGMDSGVLQRLFDPFFTTKQPGKGTGLGLPTVYGIVRQTRGGIDVSSEPGHGSLFEVYLPLSKSGPKPIEDETGADDRPARGRETLLLVEDETVLLELFSMALKQHGYTVLEAADPDEALHIADLNHREIDLVITDVQMPGTSGLDLAHSLQSRHPNVNRFLFISGHPFNRKSGSIVLDEENFLRKPFTTRDFAERVRHLLRKK